MTAADEEILHQAMGILHNEGFAGYYDGDEATRFWDARDAIEKALRKAESTRAEIEAFKKKKKNCV